MAHNERQKHVGSGKVGAPREGQAICVSREKKKKSEDHNTLFIPQETKFGTKDAPIRSSGIPGAKHRKSYYKLETRRVGNGGGVDL